MTCSEREPVQLELFTGQTIYYVNKETGKAVWLGIDDQGEIFWTERAEEAFVCSHPGLIRLLQKHVQERFLYPFSLIGLPPSMPGSSGLGGAK